MSGVVSGPGVQFRRPERPEHPRVTNGAARWDAVIAKFKTAGVDLVVLEATGDYERGFIFTLQSPGSPWRASTRGRLIDFVKAMGVLAKTDQIDARTLRDFAGVLARHPGRGKYIKPLFDE